ncbi:Na(+)/H(+) antiporter subunit B [Opitutia bacterium ISCC 51]|nr:Na(+)/H(+) antiporter subunit B [Opitutae bacterium ISCC 51]QXD29072.1 Na(+)/H(+) antiporter subunit B [Opitutae bacterium ISCC 52]
MKILGIITVIITGFLLLQAERDFPDWGDTESPASDNRLSQHYITETINETRVPNMVTAVLADYRGYDTMFETVVIFTAGIAIIGILRVYGPSTKLEHPEPTLETKKPDLIIETTCRLLIPVIQVFALYVIAHGHYSPGGGFQGGVIFGAAFILLALARDLQTAQKWVPENRVLNLAAIGIFIYAGHGVLSLIFGENFLDYSILTKVLPGDAIDARYHSMLGVEIGVAFTVTAIMFSIYSNLASNGKMEEGI